MLPSPVFSAGGTPLEIGIRHTHPRTFMRYLDHLLLVYHNTICFFQQLPEDRMCIHHFLRMMIPLDVLLHHTTPPYTGPDKRTGGYQRLIVFAGHFLQNVTHGSKNNVEAADGLHRADLVLYT